MTEPEAPPVTLVLFSGEISDERLLSAFISAIGYVGHSMGYTSFSMLWINIVDAQASRGTNGRSFRSIPIPKPIDINGAQFSLPGVRKAAALFEDGVYTGQIYLTMDNPKCTPSMDTWLFAPYKGPCNVEFGFCNLQKIKGAPSRPSTHPGSVFGGWITEFRTVFQC